MKAANSSGQKCITIARINREGAGFTIIEVALVLAVAGLIFLVVFLALPALQKSQRDKERKTDVGMIVTALQNYYADGGGAIAGAPDSGGWTPSSSSPIAQYFNLEIMKNLFPDGVVLHSPAAVATYWNSTTHRPYAWGRYIDVYFGAQCDDNGKDLKLTGSWKNAAVAAQLESGNPLWESGSSSNPVGPTSSQRVFVCVTAS